MSVLIIAEQFRGDVTDVTLELVTAARGLGAPIIVAVINGADSLGGLDGADVDEIIHASVDSKAFESDVYASALEALIRDRRPEATLLSLTANSMAYAPAVAARLGFGFASDVHHLSRQDGEIVASRSFYGSKVHGDVAFPESRGVILLLRASVWPSSDERGSPAISNYVVPSVMSRARHRAFIEPPSDGIDITRADLLVSVGRGVGDIDSVRKVSELAERMGAVLAASRPLVDAGWVPASRQVGQSGKTVSPKVYLALGISGAVQHLAGMRSSETIIAVNTDPDAAIFGVAHYGAVIDLIDVVAELDKLY